MVLTLPIETGRRRAWCFHNRDSLLLVVLWRKLTMMMSFCSQRIWRPPASAPISNPFSFIWGRLSLPLETPSRPHLESLQEPAPAIRSRLRSPMLGARGRYVWETWTQDDIQRRLRTAPGLNLFRALAPKTTASIQNSFSEENPPSLTASQPPNNSIHSNRTNRTCIHTS
jgi:hypothetical protein